MFLNGPYDAAVGTVSDSVVIANVKGLLAQGYSWDQVRDHILSLGSVSTTQWYSIRWREVLGYDPQKITVSSYALPPGSGEQLNEVGLYEIIKAQYQKLGSVGKVQRYLIDNHIVTSVELTAIDWSATIAGLSSNAGIIYYPVSTPKISDPLPPAQSPTQVITSPTPPATSTVSPTATVTTTAVQTGGQLPVPNASGPTSNAGNVSYSAPVVASVNPDGSLSYTTVTASGPVVNNQAPAAPAPRQGAGAAVLAALAALLLMQ